MTDPWSADFDLVKTLPRPVWRTGAGGELVYVNPAWLEYAGLDEAAALGSAWTTAAHPDDLAAIVSRFAGAAEAGEPYEVEFRVRRADGEYRWHHAHVAPIRDAEGAITGWAGTATDVDDRRRTEEGLRESEARVRSLVDHAGDVVYTLALDGTITAMNSAIERVLGYEPEEVIGRPVATLIAPDQLQLMPEMLARKFAGEEHSTYDLDLLTKDGRRMTVEVNSRLVTVEGRPAAIHGIARDVSARRAARAERRERERQARLAAAVGTALTAPIPLPEQLRRCAEAMVAHLDAALARVWTIDETDPGRLVLRASAGLSTQLDESHRRIPVGGSKIGGIVAGRYPYLTEGVTGDPEVHDPEWVRREGQAAFAGYPLLVGNRVLGVMGLFTRQSFVEATFPLLASVADALALGIERARVELERQAFLEAVSHDLRNPLTTLRAQVHLARRRLGQGITLSPEKLDATFAAMEQATQRLDDQLEELQDLARLQTGEPLDLRIAPVDLVALATAAVSDVQVASPHHQVRLETSETDLPGQWDPVRLRRVLDNLLGNAVKYSPDGGNVVVTVAREGSGVDRWAILSVRDEGVGIPAADLPHIFERYRRGSNVGAGTRGTGIGLAGVRQIVEQHGGRVTVESREGEGSRFTVRLPVGVRTKDGDLHL